MSESRATVGRPERTGLQFGARYRTLDESAIVEILLLVGYAFASDPRAARVEAIAALNGWIELGLGVQTDLAGGRRFDPVEVVTFLKQAGLENRDRFYADRFVATARQLVSELPDAPDQMFTVDFRRKFYLHDAALGSALRLRAPLPLASAHGRLLELATIVEGAPHATLRVSDGRLEARCVADGQREITLAATFRISGSGAGAARAPEQALPQDYLKPVDGLIVVTPAIRELAHTLAADCKSGLAALEAFWNYMMDELACGPIHYDQVDAAAPCDWVLGTGCYDCQLGSALFIALCRAQGIPARLVSGHFLYPRAPTNHYWAEAWLENRGWVPFDSWSWDLSAGGRAGRWREHFFARIDHRLVMQRLPYDFTGAIGVALPNTWHMVQVAHDGGVAVCFDGVDRRPVYRDFITVSV